MLLAIFARLQENHETVFILQKWHMTLITINNVQRAVTPNADSSELWFLCFAHRIMVIDCVGV